LHEVSRTLSRWFPTPNLIFPRTAGIDISDSSIKWLVLSESSQGYRVEMYGEEPLPQGIVVSGAVKDVNALGQALSKVKKNLGGIDCAHTALPEEAAYVFEMHVPEGTSRDEVMHMIEFEFEGRVPIAPNAAVFDYDVIQRLSGSGEEISVIVFPRELAEVYVAAFNVAGIELLSLEVEARSIARAVTSREANEPITMLVDFGRARTGFAVLKRGIPIFTSTVDMGGDAINRILKEKFSLSDAEVIAFKDGQGLRNSDSTKASGYDAIMTAASSLADEIARHYHYWDTRRNEQGDRMTPVEKVVLVGGSSNLRGLTDYIAGRVHAPTISGDIWRHVCDFDEYIPPIDRRTSLQYATAIGLALRSFPQ
jgi:type IV pilus assembly protein PilM